MEQNVKGRVHLIANDLLAFQHPDGIETALCLLLADEAREYLARWAEWAEFEREFGR